MQARKRRWLFVAAATLLLLVAGTGAVLATSAYAGFPSAVLIVDGQLITPDVPPIIVDNRVLVPVRALAEALGVKVDYNAEANTVIVSGAATRERVAQLTAENQALRDQLKLAAIVPGSGPIVVSQVSASLDRTGITHVIGVARNTSAIAHGAILVASFTDSKGKLVAVASNSISPLSPGEGRPFDIVFGQVRDLTDLTPTAQVDTVLGA